MTDTRGARAALLVVGLLTGILLTACGAGVSAPASVTASAPAPSPQVNALLTALEHTRAEGVAQVAITVTGSDVDATTGRATVDLVTGYGVVDWSNSAGPSHDLVNNRGTFRRGTDGTWMALDTATARTDTLLGVLDGIAEQAQLPEAQRSVEVTVDANGRIRRVVRHDGDTVITVDITAFGGPLDVSTPSGLE